MRAPPPRFRCWIPDPVTWLAAGSLMCLASQGAAAQDAHYQTFLVGERASGMGGAYTGIADDASASFYNPAGLAMVESSSLSGSLQVEAFNEYVVKDGYASGVGTADLSHDEQPSLPIFVGLVKTFGPRDTEGRRHHAVAISTYHPQQRSRRYRIDLFNPSTNVETRLKVDSSDQVTWYGPSYAYRLSPCFSLGASAFLASRTQRHEEDEAIITRGAFDPDLEVFRNPTIALREMSTEVRARHIVMRFGALWALGDFQLGFMFQPPGLLVEDSGNISERRVLSDSIGEPYGTFVRLDQEVKIQAPVPWELRVGASYSDHSMITVGLDAALYGPNGSESEPIEIISGLRPDPEAFDATPQTGILQVREWHRRLTANVSAGAEVVIADTVPVRAGAFTNLSAAPAIDGPSTAYAPDDLDIYGATVSVGIRTEGYDINVGALGSIGFGDGLRMNADPASSAAYLPTSVQSRTLFLFINGHKAAASRAAQVVYDEVLVEP